MEWHAVISSYVLDATLFQWQFETTVIARTPGDIPSHAEGTAFWLAHSKLISSHIFSNIFLLQRARKQAKLAQWEELETAATSDNATASTVLMYEDMHQHQRTGRCVCRLLHSLYILIILLYNGAP